MPLISIIVPVYNGEETIGETIESVRQQNFSDWELIIIDDGSTDSTLTIVEGIPDSRIKTFSFSNAGQAISRNRGIAKASGKYISFLDADDLWTLDKLECQLKALRENPQAAVAYSWMNFIDESSHFVQKGSYVKFAGDIYPNLLLMNFLGNGSNPLIRKEALDKVGGFETSVIPAEDWDMWLRLAADYPFILVPKPQVLYRISPSSQSTNITNLESASLKVIDRAFSQAPQSLHYLKKTSLANLYKYLIYKVLINNPQRRKGITALKLLGQAFKNEPKLSAYPVSYKVILKSVMTIVLSGRRSQQIIKKNQRLFKTETILGYIQTSPSNN
ncbi:MAG: glycosyltransferase [Spirulinaceae cyanobacterium]